QRSLASDLFWLFGKTIGGFAGALRPPNHGRQNHGRWSGCPTSGRRRLVSTLMPGPIVDDTEIFFRYRPFADAGLARCNSSSTARKLRSSAVGLKLALPMLTCTLP